MRCANDLHELDPHDGWRAPNGPRCRECYLARGRRYNRSEKGQARDTAYARRRYEKDKTEGICTQTGCHEPTWGTRCSYHAALDRERSAQYGMFGSSEGLAESIPTRAQHIPEESEAVTTAMAEALGGVS
jgi:hypothetical protein